MTKCLMVACLLVLFNGSARAQQTSPDPTQAKPCELSHQSIKIMGVDQDEQRCREAILREMAVSDRVRLENQFAAAEAARLLGKARIDTATRDLAAVQEEVSYWHNWCGPNPGCVPSLDIPQASHEPESSTPSASSKPLSQTIGPAFGAARQP